MRGILSHGAYLPYRRLERAEIGAFLGTGGGRGTRTVASYDQDTTTLGVEAARLALRGSPEVSVRTLWFSTVAPAYLDKTNATALHAALRLDGDVVAADAGGAVRSGVAVLRAALEGGPAALVVTADVRTGLPGSSEEADGGDGAAALVVGDDDDGEVLAAYLGGGAATAEFLDRWRPPGQPWSRQWEERFGETRYVPLVGEAWRSALKAAGVGAEEVDRVIVTGPHARAVRSATRRLGVPEGSVVDDLRASVGWTGAAHPALVLSGALETADPGQVVALVSVADGADALLFRVTDAIRSWRPVRPLTDQVATGGPVSYATFLAWRQLLAVEPPRRPEPARPSAPAAARSVDWKYGFVGSRDRGTGAVHLPPARVSMRGGAVDDMVPAPMADTPGTVVTFTVDRLAYSPSPPVVFAVVDFDDGGRLPVELTDVDVADVAVGGRVEMTFRRLFTADGIHNYFWKARPVRG